jgi:hypothetical protein
LYLAISAENALTRLLSEETIHESGNAQREVKVDVLLEVGTQVPAVQSVSDVKVLSGQYLVHLVSIFCLHKRLDTICSVTDNSVTLCSALPKLYYKSLIAFIRHQLGFERQIQ